MNIDWGTVLPLLFAGLVTVIAAFGNLRKDTKAAAAAGLKAGAETAAGQYAIWEREWKNIVGGLERRLASSEASERQMFQELADLKSKYEDCAERLRRALPD